jgi:hypothetical protein
MEWENNFLIVSNNRVFDLKKLGINLSLTSFHDYNDNKIKIGFSIAEEKTFIVSKKNESFFLEDDKYRKSGGRPTFGVMEDMIDYLLVLTNGGQVAGKLMLPGEEEKRFSKEHIIVPT